MINNKNAFQWDAYRTLVASGSIRWGRRCCLPLVLGGGGGVCLWTQGVSATHPPRQTPPCPVHAGAYRHPPAQCMLGHTDTPLPSACWDRQTPPCPVHAGTDRHLWKHDLRKLRLRAVKQWLFKYFVWFFLTFPVCSKFPDWKMPSHFPVRVGTLTVLSDVNNLLLQL